MMEEDQGRQPQLQVGTLNAPIRRQWEDVFVAFYVD